MECGDQTGNLRLISGLWLGTKNDLHVGNEKLVAFGLSGIRYCNYHVQCHFCLALLLDRIVPRASLSQISEFL